MGLEANLLNILKDEMFVLFKTDTNCGTSAATYNAVKLCLRMCFLEHANSLISEALTSLYLGISSENQHARIGRR